MAITLAELFRRSTSPGRFGIVDTLIREGEAAE
jgi:hypothetical protein